MMKTLHNKIMMTNLFIAVVFLTACSSLSEEPPAPIVTQQPDNFVQVISATGKVVPEKWVTLSLQTGGVLVEVLVEEGDSVQAGDVLIRLGGETDLAAALAAAEFESTAAEIALKDLNTNHDVALALAREAEKEAMDNLENYLTPELREALALQAIADAEKALNDAERNLNRLKTTASQADIDEAKATVILALDALDKAQDEFEPYAGKPEDNLTRATLLAKLSAAQHAYDAAVRRLNALQSTGSSLDISVAEAQLATANAQLLEAQRDWADIQDGPDPVQVALLEARVAQAGRSVSELLDGPDPDDLALAESRLSNAQAQVDAAEAALERLVLRAPFSGTISSVLVKQSEIIAPLQPAIVLADLENLVIETTDLNEIDVSQVFVEGHATVTFDALPELVSDATVIHIAPRASEGAGVNYTVTLVLDEIPDALRWGMTAFVDIDTE